MKRTQRSADSSQYRIKVLDKVFGILDLFRESRDELSISEISAALKLNKTSAFRIVSNLLEAGYLDKDPNTNKLRLGLKLYFLGSLVRPYEGLKGLAAPFLKALNQKTGETVHLVVLDQGEALYLDKIEGNHPVRVMTHIGQRLPAHCSGVGKVLLAHLPKAVLGEILAAKGMERFTDKTITSQEALAAELGRVRRQGYAMDNEEALEGVKCLAAPLCHQKRVVAAVSLSLPGERFDRTWESLIDLVVHTATTASQSISREESLRHLADANPR